MPSSYTTNLRLVLQQTGENLNTWGVVNNNQALSLIDTAISGTTAFALSGTKTLTSSNGAADEARSLGLRITGGTGGTITIPGVNKYYLVQNYSTGLVSLTTGSGLVSSVRSGSSVWMACDGTNVRLAIQTNFNGAELLDVATPTLPGSVANKSYADSILTSANAYTNSVLTQTGNLPNQSGQSGKTLTTNGSAASWVNVSSLGAMLGANNLSDLTVASTARANLGLGNSATMNVGTTGGTVAAGNDTRIVGALQANLSLSDVGSAATARNNLGLGSVATESVVPVAKGGTGVTTVAAITALINAFVGDSGAGGTKGEVPAPSAGSSAAGHVLRASGSFGILDIAKTTSTVKSLGSPSGYFKFGELYIQYTQISVASGATVSVGWPTAFPNAVFPPIAQLAYAFNVANPAGVAAYGENVSGCNIRNGSSATGTITVWAMGY